MECPGTKLTTTGTCDRIKDQDTLTSSKPTSHRKKFNRECEIVNSSNGGKPTSGIEIVPDKTLPITTKIQVHSLEEVNDRHIDDQCPLNNKCVQTNKLIEEKHQLTELVQEEITKLTNRLDSSVRNEKMEIISDNKLSNFLQKNLEVITNFGRDHPSAAISVLIISFCVFIISFR